MPASWTGTAAPTPLQIKGYHSTNFPRVKVRHIYESLKGDQPAAFARYKIEAFFLEDIWAFCQVDFSANSELKCRFGPSKLQPLQGSVPVYGKVRPACASGGSLGSVQSSHWPAKNQFGQSLEPFKAQTLNSREMCQMISLQCREQPTRKTLALK